MINMNKLFSQSDAKLVFDLVDELHQELIKKCDKYDENHHTIYVALNTSISLSDSLLGNAVNQGFAACSSNHWHSNMHVRLIVINVSACLESNISNDEYKAIIVHELGHLMNSPIFEEEPSEWYCIKNKIVYSKDIHDEIKLRNSQNDEVFADHYANKFGLGEQLKSSFLKHQQHFNVPVNFKEFRVEKINSTEVFNGNVKPIVQFV